ncbi:MAG: hypothetical protein JOZ27_04400 [Caulobacteraceae bacterium]|nr:hypothetical protein [Caulobacteraceae bacterium]
MSKEEEPADAAARELLDRRAKLVASLKESTRFRTLLREAAAQLRADAAELGSEAEAPRRRLLLESANRMDRYAADMEEDDAASADGKPPPRRDPR